MNIGLTSHFLFLIAGARSSAITDKFSHIGRNRYNRLLGNQMAKSGMRRTKKNARTIFIAESPITKLKKFNLNTYDYHIPIRMYNSKKADWVYNAHPNLLPVLPSFYIN